MRVLGIPTNEPAGSLVQQVGQQLGVGGLTEPAVLVLHRIARADPEDHAAAREPIANPFAPPGGSALRWLVESRERPG
jgi:hypothetical protein